MAKDKSEKKEKKRKGEETATEDVEMEDASSVLTQVQPSKNTKKDKEDIVIPLEDLSPIAQPLAQKKLAKRLHKTIKKGEVSTC